MAKKAEELKVFCAVEDNDNDSINRPDEIVLERCIASNEENSNIFSTSSLTIEQTTLEDFEEDSSSFQETNTQKFLFTATTLEAIGQKDI